MKPKYTFIATLSLTFLASITLTTPCHAVPGASFSRPKPPSSSSSDTTRSTNHFFKDRDLTSIRNDICAGTSTAFERNLAAAIDAGDLPALVTLVDCPSCGEPIRACQLETLPCDHIVHGECQVFSETKRCGICRGEKESSGGGEGGGRSGAAGTSGSSSSSSPSSSSIKRPIEKDPRRLTNVKRILWVLEKKGIIAPAPAVTAVAIEREERAARSRIQVPTVSDWVTTRIRKHVKMWEKSIIQTTDIFEVVDPKGEALLKLFDDLDVVYKDVTRILPSPRLNRAGSGSNIHGSLSLAVYDPNVRSSPIAPDRYIQDLAIIVADCIEAQLFTLPRVNRSSLEIRYRVVKRLMKIVDLIEEYITSQQTMLTESPYFTENYHHYELLAKILRSEYWRSDEDFDGPFANWNTNIDRLNEWYHSEFEVLGLD